MRCTPVITRVERIVEDGDHGLPTELQRIRRESVGSEAAKGHLVSIRSRGSGDPMVLCWE